MNYKEKKFLIVGVGINTNLNPKSRGFSSTSLKKIVNKNIDNNKVLNNIKKLYEKFLIHAKNFSYLKLKNKYNKKIWNI